MKRRKRWTDEDIDELKEGYSKCPIHISERLIERHGRAGCHTKAEKLGLNGRRRRTFDFSVWSETTKAYIAGIIDGEGTITVIRNNKYSAKLKKTYAYERPVIAIANTDYKLLDYLKGLKIGGFHHDRRGYKYNHSPSFQWTLTAHMTVLNCLKTIVPYLVIKKDKAMEVIQWIEAKYHLEVT